MSQEELENQVRDSGSLIERLDKCHEMIGKMCKEGRPPKMTIPVQWHDEDFFISVTLQDAIAAQQVLQPADGDSLGFCELHKTRITTMRMKTEEAIEILNDLFRNPEGITQDQSEAIKISLKALRDVHKFIVANTELAKINSTLIDFATEAAYTPYSDTNYLSLYENLRTQAAVILQDVSAPAFTLVQGTPEQETQSPDFIKVPDFTKPVDIQAFFYNEFGACGCSDLASMINIVKDLLEWTSSDIMERQGFEKLFDGNEGVFYLLAGRLDSLGFSEHGTSIRYAWLTEKGKEFLNALQTIPVEQIENCACEAYDGLSYGQ